MQRLSALGNLAMFLLVGGYFVVLYFATGTESLLAPGFDLSWRSIDSGHVERHGLTRKTSRFRIYERPRVIMLPGEMLDDGAYCALLAERYAAAQPAGRRPKNSQSVRSPPTRSLK